MTDHINQEQLSLDLDRQTTPDEHDRIRAHLEACLSCAHEAEELERTKIRLSALPRQYAPPSLVAQLRAQYLGVPWRSWMSFHFLWKSVGLLALGLVLAGFWMNRQSDSTRNHVDMDALLEAHSRYQMESLVPQADLTQSNSSLRLASFYRDEE